MSTDIERRPPAEALVTQDARDAWTDRQIALIARTVAKDAKPEELHFFLNVAARYNLDPFQGEIYCSKMRGKNGAEGRIAIIVGEQGRLKIANRYPDYKGFRSDVICANDRFLKKPQAEELVEAPGTYSYVEHSYGHPNERGEVIGAWCEVYRDARPPVFFYAPLGDYLPREPSDAEKRHSPWFSTQSRMIVKCADSTAFRMAFNLAGIYGEEEIEHIREQAAQASTGVMDSIEWGEDEEVGERMRSLFAAANNAKAGSYPPAKIRLLLAGISDEQRYEIAAQQLIPFIRDHGGHVPEVGEIVVDDADIEIERDEPDEPRAEGADEPEAQAEEAVNPADMHMDNGDGSDAVDGEEPLPGV